MNAVTGTAAATMRDAIDSVLAQTSRDLEHGIVDGAFTDGALGWQDVLYGAADRHTAPPWRVRHHGRDVALERGRAEPHPSTLMPRRSFARFGGFDPAYRVAMGLEQFPARSHRCRGGAARSSSGGRSPWATAAAAPSAGCVSTASAVSAVANSSAAAKTASGDSAGRAILSRRIMPAAFYAGPAHGAGLGRIS